MARPTNWESAITFPPSKISRRYFVAMGCCLAIATLLVVVGGYYLRDGSRFLDILSSTKAEQDAADAFFALQIQHVQWGLAMLVAGGGLGFVSLGVALNDLDHYLQRRPQFKARGFDVIQ